MNSCSLLARSSISFDVDAEVLGHDLHLGRRLRQEFVQRRIEQADGDRQAGHDLEQLDEVLALHRLDLGQRRAAALLVVGQDHLAHGHDAVALEEHVLGAAEADALGAELARLGRIGRRLGVGADAERAELVGPLHQLGEIAAELGLHGRHDAQDDLAGAAVERDGLARLHHRAAHAERAGLAVDAHVARARDAGLAHAARHHGGVAGHAAGRGQDAFRGVHAVDVLGAGLAAHQDHLLAGPRLLLGLVGGEHDLARRGARRGRQALGDHLARGLGIERRMQELVERGRHDARHGLLLVDQPFLHHVDGDLERGLGGALAVARLQHVELAALDGELDVLHVAVVLLEPLAHVGELLEHLRHDLFHGRRVGLLRELALHGEVLRRADAGHHVLALRVHEILAVEQVRAGRRIAREGDAGGAIVAHVAEHHGLHVDRGAPALGNRMQAAIGDGALVHPRVEHRADRAPELLARLLRERLAGALLDDLLVLGHDRRASPRP